MPHGPKTFLSLASTPATRAGGSSSRVLWKNKKLRPFCSRTEELEPVKA